MFDNIPYLLVSKKLELAFGDEMVYICFCLIDHAAIGVATNKTDAISDMIGELESKYKSIDELMGNVELGDNGDDN